MPPIGVRGSYGTDAPLEKNYIGEAMANVEENAFKYKAQRDLAEAKKAKEDEEKLKELEEYNNKFKVNVTGNQSIDDTTTQYAMQAKQQAYELTKQIQATTDFNKKAELMAKRGKIVQSFDILKQIPDMLIKQGADIAKGVEEGKYNPDDVNLIQEKFKSLEQGKVHYYTDDAGNLRFTTYKVDESGNPTGIIDKDQSVAELTKSLTPHLKSNYADALKNAIANTATKDVTVQNGITTTQTKKVEDAVANANAMSFGNLIANTPHEAYAIAKRYNLDPNDKKAIAEVASTEFKNGLDTLYKQTLDLGAGLAERKFAYDKKKDEIQSAVAEFGDSRKDDFLTYETVTVDKEGNKNVHQTHKTVISGDNVYQNMITFPENKLTFKNLGGAGSGLNGGFVEGITKDKKTGDWIVTGKALKQKGVKFKMPNGELLDLLSAQEKLSAGSTPEDVKSYLQAQMDSYSAGDNYGTFTRKVKPVELSSMILKTNFKTLENLNKALKEANKGMEAEAGADQKASEYTNITETNKGTIGVKNGKWYDIKTGKPIQ